VGGLHGRVLCAERRFVEARATLYKALRAARRWGVQGRRGETLHLLSHIVRETGQPESADRLALHALRAYPHQSEVGARLMVELGRAWVETGQAERALPMLRSACERFGDTREGAEGLALLARAWAVLGERRKFAEAWSRVWSVLRHVPEGVILEQVHEDLAIAANTLGDRERLHRVQAHPENERGTP
jgi:predicted Zn-dependent protease